MSFSIGHCRVKVSYYFFAVLAAAALPLSGGAFFCGIVAAFFHELGHLAAMSLCPSIRVTAVLVSPFGLRITSHTACRSRHEWQLICAAGAAANLALAGVCRLVIVLSPASAPFFADLLTANLALAALNLAPVQPLDGGELLHTFLSELFPSRAENIAFAVSLLFSIPLMTAGFFILIRSRCNFSLLLISIWLVISSVSKYLANSNPSQ